MAVRQASYKTKRYATSYAEGGPPEFGDLYRSPLPTRGAQPAGALDAGSTENNPEQPTWSPFGYHVVSKGISENLRHASESVTTCIMPEVRMLPIRALRKHVKLACTGPLCPFDYRDHGFCD